MTGKRESDPAFPSVKGESTTVNGQIFGSVPTRQTHAHDPGAHPAADSDEAAPREPAPPPSRTYHTV
jgi:hypothetical protein